VGAGFGLSTVQRIVRGHGGGVVLEGTPEPQGDDGFDADVALSTGELRLLIPDLLAALGGELVREPAVAAGEQPEPALA